jgi:hypothetical protein
MVRLKRQLKTKFHRDLANDLWVERLADFVSLRLQALGVSPHEDWRGKVFSQYSDSEYMGANSLCKYVFQVEIGLWRGFFRRARDTYSARVTYIPETDGFKVNSEKIDTEKTRRTREDNLRMADELAAHINSGNFPLESMQKWHCLECGSEILLDFRADGTGFLLECGRGYHFSKSFPVERLPDWWQKQSGKADYMRSTGRGISPSETPPKHD